MKNILSALLAVSLMLCVFTACGAPATAPSAGDSDEIGTTESTQAPEQSDTTQTTEAERESVTLAELTSTGEIPYEYFETATVGGGYYLYNTYDHGAYAQYFETELFPFCYNAKCGFADAEGHVVIAEQYDRVNFFSEDKAFVKSGDAWKIIDTKGNELYTVPTDYACADVFFQNGKAIISEEISVGYNDYDLAVLIIDEAMQTQEFKKDGGFQLQSKVINTPEFSGVLTYHLTSYADSSSNNGYRYDHHYTLYDTAGTVIWQVTASDENTISDALYNSLGSAYWFEHEYITPLRTFVAKDGYMNVVNESGKWGLMDLKTGTLALPCKYDFVGGVSEDAVAVCSYGKWGYVDLQGNELITPTFAYAGEFCNGRAFVVTADDQQAVIDKSGNIVSTYAIPWDADINQVFAFSEETGIAVVADGDMEAGRFQSFSLITANGETLLSMRECKGIYVSDRYVFLDGRMYKIQK